MSTSPPTSYQFCPFCGSAYHEQESVTQLVCDHCNQVFYRNQNTSVCGVIIFEGKLLLTKRGRDPFRGFWDLPGGFVEPMEHPEVAVIREIREELGLETTVIRLLEIIAPIEYRYQGITAWNCDHLYLLNVIGKMNIQVGDDVSGYQFFSPQTAPLLEHCAFASTKQAVQQFIQGKYF